MTDRDDDQNSSSTPYIVDNMGNIGVLGSRVIDIIQQGARNAGIDLLLAGNTHWSILYHLDSALVRHHIIMDR